MWIWLVVFVPVLTIVTLVPMMLQFAQGYAEIFRVALANVPDPSQTDPHQLDDAIRQPLFAFFANDFAWIVVGQISGFVLLAVQVVFACSTGGSSAVAACRAPSTGHGSSSASPALGTSST